MASKLIVLAALLAAGHAGPIWFVDNGFAPGTLFIREGRSPDFTEPRIAYGFGSGFAADIGGIRYSTGNSASFANGGAQAYGAGIGRTDGNTFTSGIGYADAGGSPQQAYRTNYPTQNTYPSNYSPYNGLRRNYPNNFGTASAQTNGNFGASVAQTVNSPSGSTATSFAHNRGYDSTSAVISHSDSNGNAISSVHNGLNSAIAVSSPTTNTAQVIQTHGGGATQRNSAVAYNAPRFQLAQSQANTY